MDNPPPYAPPEGPYYMADVPYGVPPPGYYGWMPSTAAFPDAPPRKYIIYFYEPIQWNLLNCIQYGYLHFKHISLLYQPIKRKY